MAITRYNQRFIRTTDEDDYIYSPIFKKRGVRSIDSFSTAVLAYPNPSELASLKEETEVWKVGTKYFNLAQKYYDNEEYWWIIAWYNLRPLETDFRPGDVVFIPTPLSEILSAFGIV